MSALTIGVDARAARDEKGGRGTYVRELLTQLVRLDPPHRFKLYTRRRWDGLPYAPGFEWESSRAPDVAWHLRAALRASAACDVFLSTNSYLTAWFTRVPTVLVVYDMVAFLPGARAQRRAARIERATGGRAVSRCAAITSISEATAADLVARYPAAEPKVVPIPLAADERYSPRPGADDERVLERHGLRRPYVLAIGTLEPRKNLPRLIEAFGALEPSVRGEARMALVGAVGWEAGETIEALTARGELVERLGHVADEDLPALYRHADLFCYPSLYEGFGLPVLEAMRCGTPVLTSRRSSLPEVAGEAAFYVEPEDVRDICDRLGEALTDAEARGRLAEAGLRRAASFSWEATAKSTLELLERVAAGGPAQRAASARS